jgi:purine catabolism regulator
VTFTVGQLVRTPALATRSLTPGVGEWRPVEWAHVCELSEPWEWIGDGALVMTTGLGVPAAVEAQCAYVRGMHDAGIVAVTIGQSMSAPPLSPQMLALATELDFPVLETALEMPFIRVAMGVAEANSLENQKRVRLTERLYAALRSHAGDVDLDGLLADVQELLGGVVTLRPEGTAERRKSHGEVEHVGPGLFETTLVAPGEPRLRVEYADATTPDYSVLQHAAAVVGSLLAARFAASRQDWLHGSLLLGDLLDAAIASEPAARFLDPHRIAPPYVMAAWRGSSVDGIEETHIALDAGGVRNLLTAKDGLVVVLGAAAQLEAIEAGLARFGPVAISAPFDEIADLPEAHRQVRLLLARAERSPGRTPSVLRFTDARPASLFLPDGPERLREAATIVLGPLLEYDRSRGTRLVPTLRVFLEENRSWVRSADRLYVHRQTLVSRISRIEEITGQRLNSISGAAELWHAIQAGVECGLLPPTQ